MKKILFIAALVLSSATAYLQAQLYTKVASLGNLDFSVDGGSTTAGYTQSANSINFTGAQGLGSTLGGLWNPPSKNWSSYQLSDFGIISSVSGSNPNIPFTLELYDSTYQIASTFTGSTFGASSSPSFLSLTLSQVGAGSMSNIVGLQFTWDAADTIDFAWEGIGVVPEPTTISLLLLGGSAVIFKLLRRRLSRKS